MHTAPGADPALELRDVTVVRGTNHVIEDLSFSLPAGTITGLMGPSGSGKTTVMRAIMGVQKITSGQITVLGAPAGSASLRRRVAYTSQAVSVYRDVTARANVEYFADLQKAPRGDVEKVLEQVELTDHADRKVSALSGGQAGRVSLACALVGSPELLVLDEPTVGLDPLTRRALWRTFRDLAAGGATLVVSSHVMDEAARCDSVVMLRDGRLLGHAPIADVQRDTGTDSPEDAFVALIGRTA